MDVEEKKCECGQPAVRINRCDCGEVAHCGADACLQRTSKQISDAAKAHPMRVQVFDAIRPHADVAIGHEPPTDRVLAVVYGLLDSAAPIVAALMSVDPLPNQLIDDWVFDSINNLGLRLAPFAGPDAPKD
jgi:hypothetical protein